MNSQIIAEQTIGTRVIAGAEYPIIDRVERVQMVPHKRAIWVLTQALCNGVPAGANKYRTRGEALEAYQDLAMGMILGATERMEHPQ